MRWVWIKEGGNFQLMNVMTLQCLEFMCGTNKTGQVAMKQCSNAKGQRILQRPTFINARLTCVKTYYLRLEKAQKSEGYTAFVHTDQPDTWTNEKNNQQLVWKNITYGGKYAMHSIKTSLLYTIGNNEQASPAISHYAPFKGKHSTTRVNIINVI